MVMLHLNALIYLNTVTKIAFPHSIPRPHTWTGLWFQSGCLAVICLLSSTCPSSMYLCVTCQLYIIHPSMYPSTHRLSSTCLRICPPSWVTSQRSPPHWLDILTKPLCCRESQVVCHLFSSVTYVQAQRPALFGRACVVTEVFR